MLNRKKISSRRLGVCRIIAEVNTTNQKSIHLLERLGMRMEATHKEIFPSKDKKDVYADFHVYALLKKEFKA